MSEAIVGLIGVLLGGLISALIQYGSNSSDYRKWKVDKKIELLKEKKINLKNEFKESRKLFEIGLEQDTISIDMATDMYYIFPNNVSKAFKIFIDDDDKSESSKKKHYYKITKQMKIALSKIDEDIEKLLE